MEPTNQQDSCQGRMVRRCGMGDIVGTIVGKYSLPQGARETNPRRWQLLLFLSGSCHSINYRRCGQTSLSCLSDFMKGSDRLTIQRTEFYRLEVVVSRCTDLAPTEQTSQFQPPGPPPGCSSQPPSLQQQCPGTCPHHVRSRTQFFTAQIKSGVSLSNLPSTSRAELTVATYTPFICMVSPFSTPVASEHMTLTFVDFSGQSAFRTECTSCGASDEEPGLAFNDFQGSVCYPPAER